MSLKETPKFRQEFIPSVSQGIVTILEYRSNQTPRVTRRGTKEIADEILRDARRYGIPVITDNRLSSALDQVHSYEEIPEELYEPVAKYLIELKLI